MTTLSQRIAEARALDKKATAEPWSIESCGEKGDGANMIGVAFGPNDDLCKHPMSGWLKPYDDDGKEIEYYRDELVAVCDNTNRNASCDAAFIARSRTLLPELADDAERLWPVVEAALSYWRLVRKLDGEHPRTLQTNRALTAAFETLFKECAALDSATAQESAAP